MHSTALPGLNTILVTVVLVAACSQRSHDAAEPAASASSPGTAQAPSTAEGDDTPKAADELTAEATIRRISVSPTKAELSLDLSDCTLDFHLEGKRLSFRAEAMEGAEDCDALDPAYGEAWSQLAAEAFELVPSAQEVGVVIDFYTDMPSVEQWFRYQADSPELQAAAKGKPHDAAYNRLLAQHLVSSGALSRYANVLKAMGLRITQASLEKVELRQARRFAEEIPALGGWGLPGDAYVALPFLTHLSLTRS